MVCGSARTARLIDAWAAPDEGIDTDIELLVATTRGRPDHVRKALNEGADVRAWVERSQDAGRQTAGDPTIGWQLDPIWMQDLQRASEGVVSLVTLRNGLFSTTGGGSAPTSRIPTVLLEVAPRTRAVAAVRKALIDGDPPVVARVEEDRLVLDLRTVAPEQDATVAEALRRALSTDPAG